MIEKIIAKTKNFLFRRQQAYRAVFDKEKDQGARIVLKDLAKFCRAHDTTYHKDDRIHAVLEGRREVWLRIVKHLELDQAQLWREYGKIDD